MRAVVVRFIARPHSRMRWDWRHITVRLIACPLIAVAVTFTLIGFTDPAIFEVDEAFGVQVTHRSQHSTD